MVVAKPAALPERECALLRGRSQSTSATQPGQAKASLATGAKIPGALVARPMVLADSRGFALAVIPGDRHIDLAALHDEFGRRFRVASESQISRLLPSQSGGDLPWIGAAPHCETFLEQSLVELPEVYFEAADGAHLIRVDGESFRGLFYGAWCGRISCTDACS